MRRGVIWISAVLYVGIGVVILGMVVAAVVPVVQKVRDRNSFLEAQEALVVLDRAVRTVAAEGPGSQREFAPFAVGAGTLMVSQANDTVVWSLETNAKLLEENVPIREGPLVLLAKPSRVVGKQVVSVAVDYAGVYDVKLVSSYAQPFSGKYALVIRHTGLFSSGSVPQVEIRVV